MLDIYYFDKTVKKAKINDIQNIKKLKHKLIWIDITNITKEERKIIKDTFNLHPLTAEDLHKQDVRIKVEEFHDYMFCVFYSISKHKDIELAELDFVLGKNFLITNHKRSMKSFDALKNNNERMNSLFKRGVDFLFYKLLDLELENYFPVLGNIDEDIEVLEEDVTKKPRPEVMMKIQRIKRLIVYIKKHTFSQREKISFLAKSRYKFISAKSVPYFRDLYDNSIMISDSLENYREAIGNTFEAYMSSVSINMNHVMKTLSVIATIALPLSVISGIYGTNFDILPGQHSSYGFLAMIIAMLSFVVIMVFVFKKRKWF